VRRGSQSGFSFHTTNARRKTKTELATQAALPKRERFAKIFFVSQWRRWNFLSGFS